MVTILNGETYGTLHRLFFLFAGMSTSMLYSNLSRTPC